MTRKARIFNTLIWYLIKEYTGKTKHITPVDLYNSLENLDIKKLKNHFNIKNHFDLSGLTLSTQKKILRRDVLIKFKKLGFMKTHRNEIVNIDLYGQVTKDLYLNLIDKKIHDNDIIIAKQEFIKFKLLEG